MTDEQLFNLSNTAILPFWLLYIFAPRWRWTQWLAQHHLGPALLAVGYVALVAPQAANFLQPDAFSYATLLGQLSPRFLVIVWFHMLALDLLAGGWITTDALRRGVPHWLSGICKFFSLMFGPFGVLLYLLVRPRWRAATATA